jgi:hypothetical protein
LLTSLESVAFEFNFENGFNVLLNWYQTPPVNCATCAHCCQFGPRGIQDDAVGYAQQPLLRAAFQIALQETFGHCTPKREAAGPVRLIPAHEGLGRIRFHVESDFGLVTPHELIDFLVGPDAYCRAALP